MATTTKKRKLEPETAAATSNTEEPWCDSPSAAAAIPGPFAPQDLPPRGEKTLNSAQDHEPKSANEGYVSAIGEELIVSAADADAQLGNANGKEDEADAEDDGPEPVQKILEPLTKDQLIELLASAATRHADVMEEVQQIADVDTVHRKIFVHGLGWDTTAETLVSVFQQYGEIEDCNAVRDKASGKSKGYGFILFKQRSGARRALKEPQKKIGNRMTACQLASAGPTPPPAPPVPEYTQRKIFVSNVSADIDTQKLLQFFSSYGEIEEGPLGLDKKTGKPKGFTLFVYKSIDGARKALEEPHKSFDGHILHCQKAIDGPKPLKPGLIQNHSSGSGGHGSLFSRMGERVGFLGGMGGHVLPRPGHLMAPSGNTGFNQAPPQSAAAMRGFNPALGQALTTLLMRPAAGIGLTKNLGSVAHQGMPSLIMSSATQGGYTNQAAGVGLVTDPPGGYGGQSRTQGGYNNASIGPGSGGWGQQAGRMGSGPQYTGY